MESTRIASDTEKSPAPIQAGVLGAGTALRFALLLLFIVVGSMSMLAVMLQWVGGGPDWYVTCTLASGIDPTREYVSDPVKQSFVRSCVAEHGAAVPVGWMFAGTAFVLALAAAIYLGAPAWRCRGGRLPPIDMSREEGLAEQLKKLVKEADPPGTPAFVLSPAASTTDAVVFGRWGKHTVCLDGGLIARSAADPGALRGVVLHELAHIRNRDVDLTYATVALWRAFLIAVVAPYLLTTILPALGTAPFSANLQIWRDQWLLGLRGLFRVAVLVAGVYLVRADILRTREMYADLDAARWAGDSTPWQGHHRARTPRFRAVERFFSLWRTHPSWAERACSLLDPAALFGVTALPMFLTGATAVIAAATTELVASGFAIAPASNVETFAAWLTAALVTGIAGIALWRAVVYAVLTSRPVPSGLRAGFWLGTGVAAGELVTFRTAGLGLLPARPEVLLGLVLGALLLTWWVTQCAELWIRTYHGRSIRPTQLLGLIMTLLLFGTWFSVWMSEVFILLIGTPRSPQVLSWPGIPVSMRAWLPIVSLFAGKPLVFAGATILWLFPLASWLRRPTTGTPEWVRRAQPGELDPGLSQGLPSLRGTAVAAVSGGVLCTLGAAVVMLGLHPAQPPAGARGGTWTLTYSIWLIVAMSAGVVITAGIVAARARRHQLVLALMAAGGAGLAGLTGVFLLATVDGCLPSIDVMASTCALRPRAALSVVTTLVPWVLGIAIYLAAIAALAGTALTRLLGRFAPRTHDTSAPARSIALHRTVVLATFALVAALTMESATVYWHSTGPATASGRLIQDQSAAPDAGKREFQAWLLVGGQELLNNVRTDFQHAGQTTLDIARSARQSGQHTVGMDQLSKLDPICTSMVRDATEAQSFAPIPDARTHGSWRTVLEKTRQSGRDCIRALREGDGPLFTSFLAESTAAANALHQLSPRLATLAQQTGNPSDPGCARPPCMR
jgi:Zn-dependent protease with chaperone function